MLAILWLIMTYGYRRETSVTSEKHAVSKQTQKMTAMPTTTTPEISYSIQFALLSEHIVAVWWTTSMINQIEGGL